MSKIYFEVEGDIVIKYTPIPGMDNAYKTEVVMTKDAFRKCYEKWIKQEPRESLDKIRAELHATAELHDDGDYYLRDEWIDEIFDKYKSESEERRVK